MFYAISVRHSTSQIYEICTLSLKSIYLGDNGKRKMRAQCDRFVMVGRRYFSLPRNCNTELHQRLLVISDRVIGRFYNRYRESSLLIASDKAI